jgi:hypothetical protein
MTVLVHFCYLALSHDQQKITEQYKNIKAGFINSDIWRDLLICVNRFRMKIDLALLTKGNQNLTDEDNGLILKEVYRMLVLITLFNLNTS